ncbi:MAG: alpha/beta hydrolase [Clostridia bacterium]|nr:alpha/beta hydrolase [Clostridia bacterium]
MQELTLKSWDGKEIFCTLWDDTENPKGVVQISHGMSEYGARYERFARFLNKNGYIVFADDHRAHGRTEDDAARGHDTGFIFGNTLKDLVFIHEYLKDKYHLPQVFIGHSYGSFLGQAFYLEDTDVKGVALLGSAYLPNPVVAAGIAALSPFQLLFKGYRPRIFVKATDVLFRYKGDKGPSQWVTGDKVSRQEFLDDRYCGIDMSINFVFSMMRGIYIANKNVKKINPERKLGIFSGDGDPIGGKGKKVKALKNRYEKYGVKDITYRLYPDARHEVLNETIFEQTQNDMLEFIEHCIK